MTYEKRIYCTSKNAFTNYPNLDRLGISIICSLFAVFYSSNWDHLLQLIRDVRWNWVLSFGACHVRQTQWAFLKDCDPMNRQCIILSSRLHTVRIGTLFLSELKNVDIRDTPERVPVHPLSGFFPSFLFADY